MILEMLFAVRASALENTTDPPPDKSTFEQYLEIRTDIETKERWIYVDGVKYREVEYKGEYFYMAFKNPGTAELSCNLKSPAAATHRADVGVQITKRTRAFIQLLRETCINVRGRQIMVLALDPRIGLTLPEDSKSAIKNKKVYVNPAGLGFSGEW